jgi:hypothetical protein
MPCHICEAEAVTRCYNCGQLVCAEHSRNDTCPSCSTGFAAGDPRADRISVHPVPKQENHGWWRPQEADEYKPPECYECKGLARGICRNCQASYCPEHAGANGLCKHCARSANMGLYIFAGMAVVMLLMFLFNWIYSLFE